MKKIQVIIALGSLNVMMHLAELCVQVVNVTKCTDCQVKSDMVE